MTDEDAAPGDEPDGAVPGEPVEADAAVDPVDVGDVDAVPSAFEAADDAGHASAVVPKRSYCERCEHFADPPAVACTHEGTDIVEVVDTDHFRVVECPVVARRREIGDAAAGSSDESN